MTKPPVLVTTKRYAAFFQWHCRFALKSLIDTACYEPIDEDSKEVHNFLAILEHIFSHRLKGKSVTCTCIYIDLGAH